MAETRPAAQAWNRQQERCTGLGTTGGHLRKHVLGLGVGGISGTARPCPPALELSLRGLVAFSSVILFCTVGYKLQAHLSCSIIGLEGSLFLCGLCKESLSSFQT